MMDFIIFGHAGSLLVCPRVGNIKTIIYNRFTGVDEFALSGYAMHLLNRSVAYLHGSGGLAGAEAIIWLVYPAGLHLLAGQCRQIVAHFSKILSARSSAG